MHHLRFSTVKKQRGAILVLSLTLLTVLTMVAITGMKTSVLEEKMSGNIRSAQLALQAAESALNDATNEINNFANINALTSTNGLLIREDVELDYFSLNTWDMGSPANYTIAPALGSTQLATPPRWIIKHMGQENICSKSAGLSLDKNNPMFSPRCRREVFRVTAHGTGLTPNTTKTLQLYYARPIF